MTPCTRPLCTQAIRFCVSLLMLQCSWDFAVQAVMCSVVLMCPLQAAASDPCRPPSPGLSTLLGRYKATRLHFQDLLTRYGGPLVVLNLVKSAEKHARETLLRKEYERAIQYLNKQARPPAAVASASLPRLSMLRAI